MKRHATTYHDLRCAQRLHCGNFCPLLHRPSIVLVAYRMGITALLLFPSVFLHRKELFSAQRKTLLPSLGGSCILGLHFAAFFQALRMTAINTCAVLANLAIIFVALGTTLIFRQKLNRHAPFVPTV